MTSKFTLPELKYSADALAPIISQKTIELHYGKHLQGYLDNLNNLLMNSGSKPTTLEEIISSASGPLFNNGAQVWNHIFYFDTLSADGKSAPSGALLRAIELFYGSFEEFKEEFEREGASLFGSGWVWLSKNKQDELTITKESNAGNPLRGGLTPLLTFDVWEHAYYVDYENRRAEHLSKMWDIVDWAVVESRFNK
ncbi:MAG: superoxide dismutase [Rikenellaceae bacterium]